MTLSMRSCTTPLVLAMLLAAPAAGAQDTTAPSVSGSWSGVFRVTQATRESLSAAGKPGSYSGSVDLQPTRESGVDLYVVTIQVSSNQSQESLEWGVSMGRCGSKLIMVENANQLPSFETRGGGEGEVHYTGAFALDIKQSYQLGLFRNGHSQQNMVACANLKYSERKR